MKAGKEYSGAQRNRKKNILDLMEAEKKDS
jgi:hypothetical protein